MAIFEEIPNDQNGSSATNNNQEDIKKILRCAEKAHNSDEWYEANSYYLEVLQRDPQNSDVWLLKAINYNIPSVINLLAQHSGFIPDKEKRLNEALDNAVLYAPQSEKDVFKKKANEIRLQFYTEIATTACNLYSQSMNEYHVLIDTYIIAKIIEKIKCLTNNNADKNIKNINERINNNIKKAYTEVIWPRYQNDKDWNRYYWLTNDSKVILESIIAKSNDKDDIIKKYEILLLLTQKFDSFKEERREYRKRLKELNDPNSTKGCYIATAIYGSYDCPQVWTLRRFRDITLNQTWYGRLFIHLYYFTSPIIVKVFGNTLWFKLIWKTPLDKFVISLQKRGFESTPYNDQC